MSPNRVLLQSVGLRFGPLLLSSEFAVLEELFFEQRMQPQMLQKRTATFTCTRSGPRCAASQLATDSEHKQNGPGSQVGGSPAS